MKKLMTFVLAGAVLTLPTSSNAWVAYRRPCCFHVGWGCGGVSTGTAVAAGVGGFAAGALIGSAAARASQPAVVVDPYYTGYPPPVVVAPAAAVGSIFYSLPPGAKSANINGTQYYVLGSTYYRPYFGNNGVYYQVAPNPI